LLSIAEVGTVSHVEKTVRLYRKGERAAELRAANRLYAERSLQWFFDEDGAFVIKGRLAAEQGALVMKALQAACDALREAEGDSREASAARRADALVLMAEGLLARGAAPLAAGERHLVTVHVDESVLRDETADGRCELEGGPALPPATVRRLCCDGGLVAVVEGANGSALDVGRKTRAVPAAMRRALDARDGGCRFPGCSNGRFVDAHHIEHWVDGGETKLDNLVLLCRRHHRAVHELGFRVEREGVCVRFVRPDGDVVQEAPVTDALERDGWVALRQAHAEMGLRVNARTGVPSWRGERMDYDWAVGVLQGKGERADDLRRIDPKATIVRV
jgi:hypothetical protein